MDQYPSEFDYSYDYGIYLDEEPEGDYIRGYSEDTRPNKMRGCQSCAGFSDIYYDKCNTNRNQPYPRGFVDKKPAPLSKEPLFGHRYLQENAEPSQTVKDDKKTQQILIILMIAFIVVILLQPRPPPRDAMTIPGGTGGFYPPFISHMSGGVFLRVA